jgi:hypothetical protein
MTVEAAMLTRYVYSLHRSREAAEAKLEDMYAAGEVCEAEQPRIERHPHPITGKPCWTITLPSS